MFTINIKKNLTMCMNFSFPENQGDALLLEIHGRAIIPIASLTENPVCIIYLYSDNGAFFNLIWQVT